MSEEEKEAITYFKQHVFDWTEFDIEENVDILLDLIEKQNKVIDLMVDDIYDNDNFFKLKIAAERIEKGKEKDFIKKCFYRKVNKLWKI